MIISTTQFHQIGEVSRILLGDNKPKLRILRPEITDSTKEYLENWFHQNFVHFPLRVVAVQHDAYISTNFIHKYKSYHDGHSRSEQLAYIEEIKAMDDESILYNLDEYLDDRIRNLFSCFSEALADIKDSPIFAGIEDNTIIFKNLLKFYTEVRQSENQQLAFFQSIELPKQIADLMTDVLIEILQDRLSMLAPDFTLAQGKIQMIPDPIKINWLGTQQDFAELFITLRKRNFISFPDMSLPSIASHFANTFNFSSSKKKSNPNIAANIYKHLKTTFDGDLKESTNFFEKENYKAKFSGIPENPKKEKTEK